MHRLILPLLCLLPTAAMAAGNSPAVAGIPVDFILFALTLLGVALFHNATLYVALTGLTTISLYKILFAGFKTGGLGRTAGDNGIDDRLGRQGIGAVAEQNH